VTNKINRIFHEDFGRGGLRGYHKGFDNSAIGNHRRSLITTGLDTKDNYLL